MGNHRLRLEEQETHLNMVADDRDTWHVYSDDPVIMARLERIGAKLVKEEAHGGKHYMLRAEQVLLRRGKPKRKPMTDEQRAELRRRLRIDVERPMGLETSQHKPKNQGK